MIIKGNVHLFGDDVDTDAIIPGPYLKTTDPCELASHCMAGIDENFPKKVKEGDIIVAGENFGCGSSREQAPISIKYTGIRAVVAESFARIFYRNCINIGLIPITCIGIKKENIDYLFEAFRQVDGAAQRRYEGAGLGLYLCKNLVTILGGKIWAESEYGKGSRFTFTLPLKI